MNDWGGADSAGGKSPPFLGSWEAVGVVESGACVGGGGRKPTNEILLDLVNKVRGSCDDSEDML